MSDDDPEKLRSKILHYRRLLEDVDDPALQQALQDLIRMTNEKLNGQVSP